LFLEKTILNLQQYIESFKFTVSSLRVNKLRTTLSLLGITIGIFSIIAVLSAIDGMKNSIENNIKDLGEDVIFIQKWPWDFGEDYPWWKYINRPLPTAKEAEMLRRKCNTARNIVFTTDQSFTLKYRSASMEGVETNFVEFEYDQVRKLKVAQGRYFTESEYQSGKPLIMIGSDVAQNLFGNINPIGQWLKIGPQKTKVIAVFEKEGSSLLGTSLDNSTVLCYTFGKKWINMNSEKADFTIYASPKSSKVELIGELTVALKGIRKLKPLEEPDFALNQTSMLSKGFEPLFMTIQITGWIIGMFSIIVGAFGIANIMFVAVKERTFQIGLQKSLGAKSNFILFQFLSEAILLCIMGGLIGIALVLLGTLVAKYQFDFNIQLSASNIFTGLSISLFVGIISGFLPSYRAAKLNPIDALRS
jgi:putative ABC transport system permease protein